MPEKTNCAYSVRSLILSSMCLIILGFPHRIIQTMAMVEASDKNFTVTLADNAWEQASKLTASNSWEYSYLGKSVAVSGDGLTVTAGGIGDNSATGQPTVYVYARPTAGWVSSVESARLTASDGVDNDGFGDSVAMNADGSLVVVGMPYRDGTGIQRGAIYVYSRSGSSWTNVTEVARLTASDGNDRDWLGASVAISADGGTIVAGAPNHIAGGPNQGAVYIFTDAPGGWSSGTQTAKLTASDGTAIDWLGWSVGVSQDGTTVIAGAPESPVGGYKRGAAYLFTRPASSWVDATEIAKLSASDGANLDEFGWAVGVSGDGKTAVAGAPDNAGGGEVRGAVYVYSRSETGWNSMAERAKLTASDSVDFNNLGVSVAVSYDGSRLLSGDPANPGGGSIRGAAYAFARPVGGWVDGNESAKLVAEGGKDYDQYGTAVALSADGLTSVAGATFNDGDIPDNAIRGAVYVHGLPTPPDFTNGLPVGAATPGAPYRFRFIASGYPVPFYNLTAGELPPGLELEQETGLLYGTPTMPDSYHFTLAVGNGLSPDASLEATIVVWEFSSFIYLPAVLR